MGKWLYFIGVSIFNSLFYLVALFNPKASKIIKGRKETKKGLNLLPVKKNTRYWFHCSSLGEFEQARPVIEAIKTQHPESEIYITFFSPSGYDQKKDFELADKVFYFLADNPQNANLFVKSLNPDVVFFVKYELWYYHLQACLNFKVKLYHLSAVFRSNHWMFRIYGRFLQKTLKKFSAIFVQDKQSLALLKSHGFRNCILAGDTRFDRVMKNQSKAAIPANISAFKTNIPLLIAGSCWPPEEELIFYGLKNSIKPFKVLLVPHDVSPKHIAELEKQYHNFRTVVYSEIDSETNLAESQVLIIDTIGMLSKLYKMADAAFIGGAYGKGLHNMLEACAFGIPICFGPEIEKYWEANEAVEEGFATIIENDHDLENWIIGVLFHQDNGMELGRQAVEFIFSHAGATKKVMSELKIK